MVPILPKCIAENVTKDTTSPGLFKAVHPYITAITPRPHKIGSPGLIRTVKYPIKPPNIVPFTLPKPAFTDPFTVPCTDIAHATTAKNKFSITYCPKIQQSITAIPLLIFLMPNLNFNDKTS